MSDDLHDTVMTDGGADEWEVPFEGFFLKAGAVVGGIWILNNIIQKAGQNPEVGRLDDQKDEILDAIQFELENPDAMSEADLSTEIAEMKAIIEAENEKASQACRVDVAEVESAVAGEDLTTTAVTWKEHALQITICRLAEESDTGFFTNIWNSLPPWAQNLLIIGGLAKTAQVVVDFLNAVLDLSRRGGGGSGGILETLGDWKRTVEEGLFGEPDNLDTITIPPAPEEIPDGTGDGGYVGTPNGALDVIGAALDSTLVSIVLKALDAAGIPATTYIIVGAGAVDLIVQFTSLTYDDVASPQGAATLILLAVLILGALALAAVDGPAPAGDAAGVALLTAGASALGVTIFADDLLAWASDVAQGIGTSPTAPPQA